MARWSVTSAVAAAAVPPARSISSTAAASSSADRATSPTAAPARASRAASSLPTPRPPPVSSATVPVRSPWRSLPPPAVGTAAPLTASRLVLAPSPSACCVSSRRRILPDGGSGDAAGELDLPHPLVRRDPLGHPGHQLLRRSCGAEHDERLGYLPGRPASGLPHDRRVRHRRVSQQDALELGRRDRVPLVLDQLLDPVRDVVPARPRPLMTISPVCSQPAGRSSAAVASGLPR